MKSPPSVVLGKRRRQFGVIANSCASVWSAKAISLGKPTGAEFAAAHKRQLLGIVVNRIISDKLSNSRSGPIVMMTGVITR